MKNLVYALLGLLFTAGLPASATTVSIEENVIYAERDSGPLTADFYQPVGIEKPPVVVMIHGGGWIRGERADMAGLAHALAEQGFAVLNISYRLAPEHRFPAALIDCRDAVRWLRRNADGLGIRADRIGAWGYSAGAHLALELGVVPAAPLPGERPGGVSPRVQAVINGAGPTDLRLYPDNKFVTQFMPEDAPESLYELASPVAMVSADDAPVMIYHGRRDAVVVYNNSLNLQASLNDAGVESELVTLPFGHVMTFLFDGDADEKAYAFLRKHL